MSKKLIHLLIFVLACAGGAAAAVPGLINFQGRLLDADKLPRTGTYAMTFRICDSLAGACTVPCAVGNPCLWTEDQNVDAAAGVFAVQLGASSAIDPAVFSGPARYLEMEVAGEIIAPRSRLTAGPYAFRTAVSESIPADTIISSVGVTAVYEGAVLNGAVTAAKLAGAIPDGKLSQVATADKVTAGAVAAGALGALVRASSVAVNSVHSEAVAAMAAAKLSGGLPVLNGAALTGLTPSSVGLGNVTNDAQIAKSVGAAKGDLVTFSAAATPVRLAAGTNGYVLVADSAQASGVKWAPPAVEWYNASAGANVNIAAQNTWYTGASLANLPAGTWLVMGHITVLRNNSARTYSFRISNGTTHYASAGNYRAAAGNDIVTRSMATVITLGAPTTILLQAAASGGTATIQAALVTNGAGNNATQITAVRLQ